MGTDLTTAVQFRTFPPGTFANEGGATWWRILLAVLAIVVLAVQIYRVARRWLPQARLPLRGGDHRRWEALAEPGPPPVLPFAGGGLGG